MIPRADAPDAEDQGGIGPYLAVLAVALMIGIGLAIYVLGYRDQIVPILTQSPT